MNFIARMTALALSAMIATSAIAGESEGHIVNIDNENATISLSDGQTYLIPVDFYVDDLQPGMKVRVVFDEEGGQKVLADLQIEE
ncbi:DUF1344 domain-containing protein [Stappia sp. F7233]|uniref:DUF1344 domain-containing protein n=1 Tax=Stappia albiluteola TaxID=2758565 RepID=A0A839ABD4_9HYPH|nr:DUF1344 domain-containing protein [Stappia albiluteola]MBA5776324.1 DUF1344 domain-containing protein [Stappia albiluteola]